jgi:hypothetical protein
VRFTAHRGDHRGGIPGQFRAMQEHHFIGQRQRRRQRLRMCAQPHRIAARLHRDHDARIAHLGTQAFQRGGDRGRVMGEIVVDGDAVMAADHFHAALDAAEARQRRDHLGRRHAHRMRGGQRSQAVEHVVAAQQRPLHIAQRLPAMVHAERAAIGGQQLGMPFQRRVETEALDRGPAAHRQHFGQCWSSPLTIRRPRAGTVRTRWWNWRWIAATSGKMSAWSYSRLLRMATSGR